MKSIKSSLIRRTLLLGLLTTAILANEQNTSKITRIFCKVHDNVLLRVDRCNVKPLNRNTTLVNLEVFVNRRVDDIVVHMRLYKKFNIYRPFLVNVRENICRYFDKKSSVPYTQIIVQIAAPYTNVNHTCPYEGYIFVKNLTPDVRSFKSLIPSGEYRMDAVVYTDKNPKPCATVQVYAEFGEKFIR